MMLNAEIGPATVRIDALQRQIDLLTSQTQHSTDPAAYDQLSAYTTAAGLLAQDLEQSQTSLGTNPGELARFMKQAAAASFAPTEVSNLCSPHVKKRKA